ncbi:hypothetical protein M3Y97_00527200 [Aphelenchoides bicaudatus]|nr:hypothetical protein M3Y97_00527200 [Aphelenchoides bicaudatus]
MVKSLYAVLALLVLVGMVTAEGDQKEPSNSHQHGKHPHEKQGGSNTFSNARPPGAQHNQGAFPKPPPSPTGGFVQRLRDFIHI